MSINVYNASTDTLVKVAGMYNAGPTIPDGKTVTPTDDIMIWQKCAGIANPTYTTLSEVLNDTGVLSALISSNNAVDYLVRSTTWAGIQLVPDMTDNTHPSGECSADSNNANAYKGFINSGWESAGNSSYPHWLCYDFQTPTRIGKVEIWENGNYYGKTGSVQAYVNGAWEDIYTINKNSAGLYGAVIPSVVTAEKYRYNVTSGQSLSTAADIKVYDMFLYSENLCDSSTAMTYIGLNNYCANTLLADATWRTAICNSTYFESVLNVKVPPMTDNTHPSGVASATSTSSPYLAYMAFDGVVDNSHLWVSSSGSITNQRIQYKFENAVKIFMAIESYTNAQPTCHPRNIKYQCSSDNITWTDKASETWSQPTAFGEHKTIFTSPETAEYWGLLAVNNWGNEYYIWIHDLQFYGREDV